MSASDPRWLLHAWEAAGAAPAAARGAVLCEAAGVAPSLDAALDWTLDELAQALARVYRREFGPTAQGLLTCTGCSEVLDVEVPLGRLADPVTSEYQTVLTAPSGRVLRLRVPTTRDVLEVGERTDAAAALVERCVTDARPAPPSRPAEPLDRTDLSAVDAHLQTLAGAAAVTVSAVCPSCGSELSAPVDVADFVWERVQQHAPALLAEVAELAREFGWAEDEVLALPPMRRRAYLALARRAAP